MGNTKVHVYVKPKGGAKKSLGGVIRTSATGEIVKPKRKREEKEYNGEELVNLVSAVVKEEEKLESVGSDQIEKVNLGEQVSEGEEKPDVDGSAKEETACGPSATMSLGEHVHTLHQLQADFGTVLTEIDTNVGLKMPVKEKKDMQIALDPYLRQNEPLRVLEAALFMAGQGVDNASLGKVVGIASVSQVQKIMSELSGQYKAAGSAIEIMQDTDKRWFMRVKSNYAPAVKQFAGEAEISKRALRTLAYVSKNEGVTKRNLFKRLGGSIYEDVSELTEKGFISTTPFGRTKKVHLTEKFRQYFEL